ncbi:MAG: sigma-70 family RNA polymerase sigma factor [Acidimicrobiia bacterium]
MTFDRRARFQSIADEVFEPLQRFLRRRAIEADADEAFSETLLVLWRRLDDVPDGAALPWAYGVARRVLANQQRGSRRRQALQDRLTVYATPQPTGDPTDGFEHPEVADALDRLPKADREVLVLWAWEDLEPRDIAVVLGTTVNAATLRLSRARKKIARLLRQDQTSPGHLPVDRHIEEQS